MLPFSIHIVLDLHHLPSINYLPLNVGSMRIMLLIMSGLTWFLLSGVLVTVVVFCQKLSILN